MCLFAVSAGAEGKAVEALAFAQTAAEAETETQFCKVGSPAILIYCGNSLLIFVLFMQKWLAVGTRTEQQQQQQQQREQ